MKILINMEIQDAGDAQDEIILHYGKLKQWKFLSSCDLYKKISDIIKWERENAKAIKDPTRGA